VIQGDQELKSAALQSIPAMSIGKLAAATGATIDTMRFHENSWLLPTAARTASGYRNYSREDALRLSFIARALALQFFLAVIREVHQLGGMRDGGVARVLAVAKKKLRLVAAGLDELEKLRTALQALVSACLGSGDPEHCPILIAFRGDGSHG
jgi:MerR family transcriptional regulator, copper efflux regulator